MKIYSFFDSRRGGRQLSLDAAPGTEMDLYRKIRKCLGTSEDNAGNRALRLLLSDSIGWRHVNLRSVGDFRESDGLG
jgi:hypothetical protein